MERDLADLADFQFFFLVDRLKPTLFVEPGDQFWVFARYDKHWVFALLKARKTIQVFARYDVSGDGKLDMRELWRRWGGRSC